MEESTEYRTEVLVVGGSLGGCAAALAAARLGRRVLLIAEDAWVGGQWTTQGVAAPDEHPWIERFGATASYLRLRRTIRAYYRRHYPLAPDPGGRPLNPGNGTVSRLCHEPRVGLAALEALLAPYRADGRLVLWHGWRPIAADVQGDRIRAVALEDAAGRHRIIQAPLILDASEQGDLLPLAGVEYRVGAEAAAETGEPHAPAQADPQDVQAFTWCAALDHRPGEDHTIPRPPGYHAFAARGHLRWEQPHPRTGAPRRYGLFPGTPDAHPLWTYRRLLDAGRFRPGTLQGDLTLVNWPQNDYDGGSILDQPAALAVERLEAARQLTLSLVHWLQTEAPRPDGGCGWPGLRLRPDALGTEDGLARAPYLRESRRIVPQRRVLEQDIAAGLRTEAEPYPDSVGIGLYRIDLHPSASGRGYVDIGCCPFRLPLGALLPQRVENLLPACKNLGTTHITNGALRLHPVEWNIGEAAGALAAVCVAEGTRPHAIAADPHRLAAFQQRLVHLGVPLAWPAGVTPL